MILVARQGAAAQASLATLAVVACLLGAPAPAPATSLDTPNNVDTGIRRSQCYRTGSDAMTACGATDIPGQDGQLGRDTYKGTNGSADGALGFSFGRICNNGDRAGHGSCPALPVVGYGDGDWGCVEDRLTGMMMEVKALDGWRSRDLRYTNYSPHFDPLGQYGSPTDAKGFEDAVNAAGLCGHDDWELGHSDKIQAPVDYGVEAVGAARADARYFPTLQADWYWNASLNPSSVSTAFALDFADGAVSNDANRGTRRYVQVVRNAKPAIGPHGRYEYSPDGSEVRDTTRNAKLTWRRCAEGMAWDGTTCTGMPTTFTHEQALLHAAEVAATTGVAWRVPSVKELDWLVRRDMSSPAITHDAFPRTPPVATWTSTPEVRNPSTAWVIDFSVGLVAAHARDEALVLRLARDTAGN
jgi:hypothetical protein